MIEMYHEKYPRRPFDLEAVAATEFRLRDYLEIDEQLRALDIIYHHIGSEYEPDNPKLIAASICSWRLGELEGLIEYGSRLMERDTPGEIGNKSLDDSQSIVGIDNEGEWPVDVISEDELQTVRGMSAKEPPKEAAIAYKLYYSQGITQKDVAELMSRQLKKPVNQGQVSRWIKQQTEWRRANNLHVEEKASPTSAMDPRKLTLGQRTDGRGTGDPKHKKSMVNKEE